MGVLFLFSVGRRAARLGPAVDLGAVHNKVNSFFALQYRHAKPSCGLAAESL
jgi:hypothetical protein